MRTLGARVRQGTMWLALLLVLEQQYQVYSQSGIQFRGVIPLKPGATMLRVLVQDAATAEVGCVIVPLEKVQ
jgi:hypothetical protein